MRRATLIVVAIVVAAVWLFGQSKPTEKMNLEQFSSDQLKACFDNPPVCGTDDVYAISDELANRLPMLPTQALVGCFDNWKICGVGEGHASGWPISDELARRGNPDELLQRYWKEKKWTIRGGIEHVAYHFDTPEVTTFMRRVMLQRVYDGEDRYWPVNYLAKKCDTAALKELASGRYRNQGSLQYETSVELFGKCDYRPAIPYLVSTALYDSSLNVVGAAEESLRALYPDAPKDFDSLAQEQRYFCRRARQEGFKVTCKAAGGR